jgi:hypothetical protein
VFAHQPIYPICLPGSNFFFTFRLYLADICFRLLCREISCKLQNIFWYFTFSLIQFLIFYMLEFNLQHLYQQITWEPCDEKFDHFPLTMHMSNSHFPLLMPNFILELFIPVVGGCGMKSRPNAHMPLLPILRWWSGTCIVKRKGITWSTIHNLWVSVT